MTSRRSFLRSTAIVAAASAFPLHGALGGTWHALNPAIDPEAGADDPGLRELAMRALDAARVAGATYADVRMTADRTQSVELSHFGDGAVVFEAGSVYIGVRALAGGYWGFASGTIASTDTVTRLAREAVNQAQVNNWGTGAHVELDPFPSAATGSWTTKIERDPFLVPAEEKADLLRSLANAPEVLRLPNVTISSDLTFRRQHKVFAATSGAYVTQTHFWSGPSNVSISIVNPMSWQRRQLSVPVIPLQSAGYETAASLRLHDRLPELVDQVRRQDDRIPLPVGRYTIVFDAQTTAALLRSTIGYATELDRIYGTEVNATGTSYLKVASLGTQIAKPLLTVTGTRTLPRGPSATGWDDEGIPAGEFDLVRRGILTNVSTGREHARMLGETGGSARTHSAGHADRNSVPRSLGCSSANSAKHLPLVRCPDLVMQPSSDDVTFDSLVANTKHGIAVLHGDCAMDRSLSSGQGRGYVFEIRDGALGKYFGNTAAFRFKTSELLNSITAIGGQSSAELHGFTARKGEPSQSAAHGVVAVPMQASDIIMFDSLSF